MEIQLSHYNKLVKYNIQYNILSKTSNKKQFNCPWVWWGRLAQGNQYGVTSTDTIDFIHKYEVPKGQRVAYATYVVDYRPLKMSNTGSELLLGEIG